METIVHFLRKIDSGEGNAWLCVFIVFIIVLRFAFIAWKEQKQKKI